jgi:S1-C subfamily serine protease
VLLSVSVTRAQELRRSGFVGLQVTSIPDAAPADRELARDVGVLVQALVDDGSAKAAGLEPNDIITDVGDHTVTGVADFRAARENPSRGRRPDLSSPTTA